MDLDKLNIQGMLDKFKQTREGLDKTFRDIFAADDNRTEPDGQQADDVQAPEEETSYTEDGAFEAPPAETAAPEQTAETAPGTEKPDMTPILDKLNEISERLGAAGEDEKHSNEEIESIRSEIGRVIRLTENLSAKVNNLNEKVTGLGVSLAGVAKLNDSIFDLKNSQMNTKNTLGDLEGAFYGLKKKMRAGVMILGILTGIIAVLEILNLLS